MSRSEREPTSGNPTRLLRVSEKIYRLRGRKAMLGPEYRDEPLYEGTQSGT